MGNDVQNSYYKLPVTLNDMELCLDAPEARVLGALLEKEVTTPEYYPLSLNALVNACNQKSNREPVVSYDEATVEEALEGLRQKGLSMRITGADNRVPKYAHRLTEAFNLGRREAAVLCVLLLRGPQTLGELRGRTERMYRFDDLEAVEATLNRLAEWETGALAQRLPRQAGFKEVRFAHLLCGPVDVEESVTAQAAERGPSLAERVATLEHEVAELKRLFADFRRQFE
jgi:uncharacterized protein YceH (UPF0502 family)